MGERNYENRLKLIKSRMIEKKKEKKNYKTIESLMLWFVKVFMDVSWRDGSQLDNVGSIMFILAKGGWS